MSRKQKPTDPVEPDLPEWDRRITVTVFEDVRPSRKVADACTACVARWEQARATNPKTLWHEATCPAHPVSQREVTYEEKQNQFERFLLYRDHPDQENGKPPSLRQVAAAHGLNAATLRWCETLSPRFRWVDRRAQMRAAERQAKNQKRKKRRDARDDISETRQESLRDEAWHVGEELLARGRQMAKVPIFEQKVEKGGKVTIYKPIATTRRDVLRYFETAIELKKFGAEIDRLDAQRRAGTLGQDEGIGSAPQAPATAEAGEAETLEELVPQLSYPDQVLLLDLLVGEIGVDNVRQLLDTYIVREPAR